MRLQLQTEAGSADRKPRMSMLRLGQSIFRNEGAASLYRGLGAAIIRQCVYGGISIGAYQPVRNFYAGDAVEPSLLQKIAAAATTGCVGSAFATPCDVVRKTAQPAAAVCVPITAHCAMALPPQVKVRLQADGRLREPRYRGTLDAFIRIPRQEGLIGLYRGVTPTLVRAAAINGAGIATYDHTKHTLLRLTRLQDSIVTHIMSSGVSGFLSALVSTPFDVIKTRIMNQHAGRKLYSGMVDCAVKTMSREGVGAMFNGFLPAYLRLAPWQLVFFVVYEQVSKLVFGSTLQTRNG